MFLTIIRHLLIFILVYNWYWNNSKQYYYLLDYYLVWFIFYLCKDYTYYISFSALIISARNRTLNKFASQYRDVIIIDFRRMINDVSVYGLLYILQDYISHHVARDNVNESIRANIPLQKYNATLIRNELEQLDNIGDYIIIGDNVI